VALGLDPTKQNNSNVGRPIRLADPEAKPVTEIVGWRRILHQLAIADSARSENRFDRVCPVARRRWPMGIQLFSFSTCAGMDL
jgi:hypothetical protein